MNQTPAWCNPQGLRRGVDDVAALSLPAGGATAEGSKSVRSAKIWRMVRNSLSLPDCRFRHTVNPSEIGGNCHEL